jgi:hypothetical protein
MVGWYFGESFVTAPSCDHSSNNHSSYNNPQSTVAQVLVSLKKERGDILFNPAFFETRESLALKANIRMVKPVIDFQRSAISLGYNIGTRGNGHDAPRWPDDLMQEEIE